MCSQRSVGTIRSSTRGSGHGKQLQKHRGAPRMACYAVVGKGGSGHLYMRAACMVCLSYEGRALTFAKTPAMAL
jgi:hypothetical protein